MKREEGGQGGSAKSWPPWPSSFGLNVIFLDAGYCFAGTFRRKNHFPTAITTTVNTDTMTNSISPRFSGLSCLCQVMIDPALSVVAVTNSIGGMVTNA